VEALDEVSPSPTLGSAQDRMTVGLIPCPSTGLAWLR
jgi:hypothetical protein